MQRDTAVKSLGLTLAGLAVLGFVLGAVPLGVASELPGATSAPQIGMADNPSQDTAYVRVVHAVPNAGPVDVSVNNETVATNVSLGNASEYVDVESGDVAVTITAAGDEEEVVYEDNVSISPRTVETLIARGELGEAEGTPFGVTPVVDNALEPGGNYSALSFAHLSPDAPAVDVTVENESAENGTTVLFDNVSYGEISEYVTVPEGDHTLQVRNATEDNDGEILYTTEVDLEDEMAFTALAVGYTEPQDTETDSEFQVALNPDVTVEYTFPQEELAPSNETTTEAPANGTMTASPMNETTEAPMDETTEAPMDETTEAPTDETTEAPTDETTTEAPLGEDTTTAEEPTGDETTTEEDPFGDETTTEAPTGDETTTTAET